MNTNYIRYKLLLGALLHDIGKLGQRAFKKGDGLSVSSSSLAPIVCPPDSITGDYSNLHVLYTNEFFQRISTVDCELLNDPITVNCAIYNQCPVNDLQKIVQEADLLSSAMERTPSVRTGNQNFRDVRLYSIFDQIDIGFGGIKDGLQEIYRLTKMTFDFNQVFPIEAFAEQAGENSMVEYADLWEGIIECWKKNQVRDKNHYIYRALSDLETYTWCVPSATNALSDISLFDHLKTTAAIAACLYDSIPGSDEPFLLIEADFGGIQTFIYDLKMGVGGTAKRLRGRSFFVSIFTELVAYQILRSCNLTNTNQIMSAGGHFFLLLPNRDEIKAKIMEYRRMTDQWSLEKMGGEIRLNIGITECSRNDILSFPKALLRVKEELAKSKAMPFSSCLVSNGKWNIRNQTLSLKTPSPSEGLCGSCGKNIGQIEHNTERGREIILCPICKDQSNIGGELTKAAWIAINSQEDSETGFPLGSFKVGSKDSRLNTNDEIVLSFENSPLPDTFPTVRWLYAHKIPSNELGETLDFNDIAGKSKGARLIGVLKADVDNLGLVFQHGLTRPAGEDYNDASSISRIATLSRALNMFFAGWLQNAVNRDEFKNIYIVYSGGDDLLCIGPWDTIFDFGLYVRKRFAEYVNNNPNITLSAGIAVAQPAVPLLELIESSEYQLKAAKAVGQVAGKKDKVSVFNEVMSWEEFDRRVINGKNLVQWVETKIINTSQVRILSNLSMLHKIYKQTHNIWYLRYVPMLIWDLKRNWKQGSEAIIWAHAFSDPESERAGDMGIVTQYALLAIRKQNDEDNKEGAGK